MTTRSKNGKKVPAAKPKRLTIAEIFRTAKKYEDNQKIEAAAAKEKKAAQNALVEEIGRRKVSSLESDKFGGFTRITRVQNSHMEYDADTLWEDLTPAQRRLVFSRHVDLNALSSDARKRVVAALSAEELESVTTYSLDVDKLAQAVQDRKVKAKTVAAHAREVLSAAYIRISHGSGE